MSRPIKRKKMREIKFRGKSLNTREWVKGYYLVNRGRHYIAPDELINPLAKPSDYEVAPDTIGQYTGVKDIEGNEIYEGDLVSVQGLPLGDRRSKVEYIERGGAFFCTSSLSREYLFVANTRGTVNVIGNIHDDPELLEL